MTKAPAAPPDEVLVVAAILGDFDAFNELVLRYRAAVVRTAETFVGRADAEDVAQDALLLAFKALSSIEDPTRFAAWLMAVTRNRALRYRRRKRTHEAGRVPFDVLLLETMGALSQPLLGAQETEEEVQQLLDRLPADYALVLRLRFLDAVPLKRIAAFLGVPLSTVKWRVHRGKALARQELAPTQSLESKWIENG